jgi:hypothetical protein
VQSGDRYHVLGVSRDTIRLFEGNRDALDEIAPAPGVPRTITDALGAELTEPHLTVASYGSGAGGTPMRHGHGSKKDEVDSDTERFFRAVDRAVLERHTQPSGLPLMLAALPEHQAVFRRISHNQKLVPEGIDANPESLTGDALRERAWRVMEPRYLARLAGLVAQFSEARAKGLGDDDLDRIGRAVAARRIGTLLIEAERQVPGRIVDAAGRVEAGDLDHPETDDLLDDLGERVLQTGGEVVVVPAARMPTGTGAAAIYRF